MVVETIDWFAFVCKYITKYDILLLLGHKFFFSYSIIVYYYLWRLFIQRFIAIIRYNTEFFEIYHDYFLDFIWLLQRIFDIFIEFFTFFLPFVYTPIINGFFNTTYIFYNFHYSMHIIYFDTIELLDFIILKISFFRRFILDWVPIIILFCKTKILFLQKIIINCFSFIYYDTILGRLLRRLRKKFRFLLWYIRSYNKF